jgi:hypothetical protein
MQDEEEHQLDTNQFIASENKSNLFEMNQPKPNFFNNK